ncbi:MAG: hypothetical protein JKY94_07485 [Rhodobacteraceae bacterium]|nr:hypothetical protein [Paracoccaceae bacterium]
MTLTFPMFIISNLKRTLRAAVAQPAALTNQMNSEGDNAIAERAFLYELMSRNPEAIQSDLDLMAMMTQYPRQF